MSIWEYVLPWYWTLIAGVIGIVLGGLIVRKFGTRWLDMLAWLVGDEELSILARVAWDAGIVPTTLKRVVFHNNEEDFVNWVLRKAHGLQGTTTSALESSARTRGYTTAHNN